MKRRRLLPQSFWAILFCAVTGCAQAPVTPSPQPWDNMPPVREDTIGRLQVDGPNAFINGAPAGNGAYVRNGDIVSTREKTSAKVLLNPGGFVQLDENTDPEFTLIKQGACLLIKFVKGQGLLKNAKCIEAEAGSIQIVLKSLVNVKTTDQEAQITVLEGHVDVTSPVSAAVEQFQQYSLNRAGETRLVQLTKEQAYATSSWSQRYFRPPTVQQGDGLSPAETAAGAAIIGGILWQIFKGHDSHPHSPPPNTAPAGGQPTPAGGQTAPAGGTNAPRGTSDARPQTNPR